MTKSSQDESSRSSGLTFRDFQKLPDPQQHLINWIRRQNQASLLDVAIHICQDEETALKCLEPLVKKGFLEETIEEDERYYRVTYPPKRGQSLFKKLAEKKKASTESQEESETDTID
ncbi:hypothetical protein [Crocosphaera sp. XPORK-15E]|uniref:hypothetical protein n=1 Tax=Crocosphaera sp. XPORK-15E TaxID=3110247 RepID=UPI002B1FC8AB|nr:hypothetical protein [Crocosphaera sp. XPORK-15E]MEA5536028.1 hypothetical protein [Crocosphaera sp. XPORK-15E]